MIGFVQPRPASDGRWESLTFPSYRERLTESGVFSLGAEFLGEPAGLAVALLGPTAKLLSIAVRPSLRGRGIATRLLAQLEEELRRLGSARMEVVFIAGQPSTQALERVLALRGFSPAEPRMLVCRSTIELLRRAPFVARVPESAGRVFEWAGLGAQEKQALRDELAASDQVPEWASPFGAQTDLEPGNSIGLVRGGRIAGWMITHRPLADTVRYSRLFVRRGERPGLGFMLVGHSILLHAERLADAAPLASMDLGVSNRMMVNFLARRLRPFLSDVAVSKASVKELGPAADGPRA